MRRNGVRLDASVTLHDLGTSAYLGEHRRNADRHALAAFLKLVENGKIAKGSYLLIENLDRLSREEERPALRLWMDILDAGINIVQLTPETIFRHEKSDMFDIMRAIMELSRGHGESAIKSERVGAAWAEKKEHARRGIRQPVKKEDRVNGMAILTHNLPAWVEEQGGELRLIPARAVVVRQIFALAAGGYGLPSIVKRLIADKVPAFGRCGAWRRSYINNILKDRRALGELQPKRRRDRKADGDPIPNYFPAVVGEEEWLAARAGAAQRKKSPGRLGKNAERIRRPGVRRQGRRQIHAAYLDEEVAAAGRGHVARLRAGHLRVARRLVAQLVIPLCHFRESRLEAAPRSGPGGGGRQGRRAG